MIGYAQLTLLLAAGVAAGGVGLFSAMQQNAGSIAGVAKARDELSRAFNLASALQKAMTQDPLASLGRELPGGSLYCPASSREGARFFVVHPGLNKVLETSCESALAGEAGGDDLQRAGFTSDFGKKPYAGLGTDWLSEAPVLKENQVTLTEEGIFYSRNGEHLPAYVRGDNPLPAGYKLSPGLVCPVGMTLVGTDNGAGGLPFCVDTFRTDKNLTQAEAEKDCAVQGKSLITSAQFSRMVFGLSAPDASNPNLVGYSKTEAGLSSTSWPDGTPFRGLPKGGSLDPAHAPGGTDEAASSAPFARRWVSVFTNLKTSPWGGKVWDLADVAQWTSSTVAREDIGKPVGSQAVGWTGYPASSDLRAWSNSYSGGSAPFSFPNGVPSIGYLLLDQGTCWNTQLQSHWLAGAAFTSCFVAYKDSNPYNSYSSTNGDKPVLTPTAPELRREAQTSLTLDVGYGGYFAADTPAGVPLGVMRGGSLAGSDMKKGVYSFAIVPTSTRGSHRCALAPKVPKGF